MLRRPEQVAARSRRHRGSCRRGTRSQTGWWRLQARPDPQAWPANRRAEASVRHARTSSLSRGADRRRSARAGPANRARPEASRPDRDHRTKSEPWPRYSGRGSGLKLSGVPGLGSRPDLGSGCGRCRNGDRLRGLGARPDEDGASQESLRSEQERVRQDGFQLLHGQLHGVASPGWQGSPKRMMNPEGNGTGAATNGAGAAIRPP